MESKWKLGEDLIEKDNVLDGFTFDDVILALHHEPEISEKSARNVLKRILENRLEDMEFLFEKNLEEIIIRAKSGRETY